jgi:hypothetical protein
LGLKDKELVSYNKIVQNHQRNSFQHKIKGKLISETIRNLEENLKVKKVFFGDFRNYGNLEIVDTRNRKF